jgi:hypothetical protein
VVDVDAEAKEGRRHDRSDIVECVLAQDLMLVDPVLNSQSGDTLEFALIVRHQRQVH